MDRIYKNNRTDGVDDQTILSILFILSTIREERDHLAASKSSDAV
jgi:hypothetical protein